MLNMEFANPGYLWLLLLVPLLALWYYLKDRDPRHSLRFASFQLFGEGAEGGAVYGASWYRHAPIVLRLLALALLVMALARPQDYSSERESTTEGIDIVLSMDVSGSMLAKDFEPNRIEAAKKLGIQFISGRRSDRMGLVIFAGESFTMCPLTIDHATLINQFNSVESGMLEDGTAIGSGLAMAVKRLMASDARSRVVILLTDGENNTGEVSPRTAAEIAATYGVRVYVIGIGTEGQALYPVQTPYGMRYEKVEVHIDEPLMRELAHMTGGEYFRATDNASLEAVYERIDQLEKSKIHVDEYVRKDEAFMPFALLALLLLLLDLGVRGLLLRVLP